MNNNIEKPERKLVKSIALTYTLGFVLTNISLSLCNASFSETVKSGEPISSLILVTLTRGEDAVTTIEWLTTLPIVLGVGLSSYSESSFNFFGFIAAALSNFMFSMRGVNTKQLRRIHGTPLGLDDIHLFYYISKFGASIVVPLAFLFEGRSLFRLIKKNMLTSSSAVVDIPLSTLNPSSLLLEQTSRLLTPQEHAADQITEGNVHEEGEEGGGTIKNIIKNVSHRILEEIIHKKNEENHEINHHGVGGGGGESSTMVPNTDDGGNIIHQEEEEELLKLTLKKLFLLLLLNGCCYFIYNQASFMVLGRVKFVTHATLNVMRRIFIIVFTSWWFMISISQLNMIGIFLAISGFALFLYLKAPGGNHSMSLSSSSPLPR